MSASLSGVGFGCSVVILSSQISWCRPFDSNLYEDEVDEDEVLDEEGRARLKLKVWWGGSVQELAHLLLE